MYNNCITCVYIYIYIYTHTYIAAEALVAMRIQLLGLAHAVSEEIGHFKNQQLTAYHLTTYHLSNTTCLTHLFFKSDE